jgi:hypothetical protein
MRRRSSSATTVKPAPRARTRRRRSRTVSCGLDPRERLLLERYRTRTWRGGLPHLASATGARLGERIGITTRQAIIDEWSQIGGTSSAQSS